MLTPDYLLEVADQIDEIYDRLTMSIVRDIARSITRIGVTRVTALQLERLQESGMLHDQIIREIAAITGKSERALSDAFRRAGAETLRYDDSIYRAAGLEPIPLNQSPRMLAILTAGLEKTQGMLTNLVMTTATAGQNAFIQAADLAYMQVASGALPYTQAISDAVRNMAQQGAMVVNYKGTTDQVDVAVRRAVVTGVNQTMGQLTEMRLDEMGVDLVETTAHYGARHTHRPWQGRVFSRSGRSEKYPDFRTATGYGTGAGLKGYNCRHDFFPFIDGVSEPAYTEGDVEAMNSRLLKYEGKTIDQYDAAQKQRGMERDIRKTNRQLAAVKAAHDEAKDIPLRLKLREDTAALTSKLQAQEAEIIKFTREVGLKRQYAREQVYA